MALSCSASMIFFLKKGGNYSVKKPYHSRRGLVLRDQLERKKSGNHGEIAVFRE